MSTIKNILGLIIGLILMILLIIGAWYIEKKFNYSFAYDSKVISTINKKQKPLQLKIEKLQLEINNLQSEINKLK